MKKIVIIIAAAVVLSILFYSLRSHETNSYASTADWSFAGGTELGTKYSQLDQINHTNLHELRRAWVYHSGSPGNVQINPLAKNGKVYITTARCELIALDGATGKELWKFNPSRTGESLSSTIRGVAFWSDKNEERIYYTSGSYLNAVNALNGRPVEEFGDKGRINISSGLPGAKSDNSMISPGYPVIHDGLVVIGGMSWSAPAVVSAFDVQTGERKWMFNLVPHPGEDGYASWGDTTFYRNGAGVNSWGGMSFDQQHGIIYVSTGQPKSDFFRGDNKGAQLYGNSIVALNIKSGKKLWHYQTIHHDLWDLDLPCAPILCDVYDNGKKVPGLVQLSKTGNVYMFNRLSGKVLSKIEERPVPPSSLAGEHAFPTQPFVLWPEPFSRQVVQAQDITTLDSASHHQAMKIFKETDTRWFAPPSEKGILYYGIHGGAEWGGGVYDADEETIYVNANELAWHIQMKNINAGKTQFDVGQKVYLRSGCVNCHGAEAQGMGAAPPVKNLADKYSSAQLIDIIKQGRGAMPAFPHIEGDDAQQLAAFLRGMATNNQRNSASDIKPEYQSLGYNKFLDLNGYPATKPPWGTLNAIDLRSGKISWKVPLGEYDELKKRGIPATGTENFGGCIATAGGLIFVGATRDEKFRAFDKKTGKLLWETKLPFGGYATPSTYSVYGRQFVLIAATGGGKLATTEGDAYVAYALPDHP